MLAAGAEQGVFQVDDPDFLANHLYAQGLGAMHLARVAAGVRELAPGVPQMFPVDPKDVIADRDRDDLRLRAGAERQGRRTRRKSWRV